MEDLRHDEKWCASLPTKGNLLNKRRKVSGGPPVAIPSSTPVVEASQARPPGIKAAKGKGKRSMAGDSTNVEE